MKTRYSHLGARDTSSCNYSVLSCIFEKYKINDSDVLVDVGCGKGRVINWWLMRGHRNKIIGLEIDEQIANKTKKKFASYGNVEVICGNALENIPEDGTIFYFYNSFDRSITKEFKDRMKKIYSDRCGVTLIYACCEHLDAFSGDPAWTVYSNASAFFKNDRELSMKDLDLPTSYPIAVIELRPV